ncbi:MAG: sigma 54-interacting transcriptional regulator [Bacteroidetes bacterium]|nr:sigma 54-interacting transcriptional regulator [Bacteroidota bacterium]
MQNSLLNETNLEILDSLAEGVYIIDKEFIIQFVNEAAENITGIKRVDVIGKLCKNFCMSERCQLGCPIAEVIKTGKNIIDLESTLQKYDGELIPVKLNAALIKNNAGTPIGGIISFRHFSNTVDIKTYLEKHQNFFGIIGKSKAMHNIYQSINEIAKSNATVLITGETGVGKELVANAIKETSPRRDKVYVKVNCAVFSENLLGSELYGHVKGAFTDAVRDRVGRFEYADSGTILLDEIGEMPLVMQTQLLRVIQEGTFERLGESITRRVNVRIIASTNKNLTEEIKKKKFRQDLFYRLNVFPIHIPPLRERKEDISPLANYFLNKFAELYKRKIDSISDEAMDALMQYDWPGNIRELENAIEYSFIRSKREDTICICCLPPEIRMKFDCNKKLNFKEIEKDEKTQTLLSLLKQNNWNKTKVAEILGVNRSTIHRQIKSIK